MSQRQFDKKGCKFECEAEDCSMCLFSDDYDWGRAKTDWSQAGEPDAEAADSLACWFGGLLEDPLEDQESSEEEDYIEFDESILLSSSKDEVSGPPNGGVK